MCTLAIRHCRTTSHGHDHGFLVLCLLVLLVRHTPYSLLACAPCRRFVFKNLVGTGKPRVEVIGTAFFTDTHSGLCGVIHFGEATEKGATNQPGIKHRSDTLAGGIYEVAGATMVGAHAHGCHVSWMSFCTCTTCSDVCAHVLLHLHTSWLLRS